MTTSSNKRQKRSVCCPHCGLLTHQRIKSWLCQKNPSRFPEEEAVVAVEDRMGEDPKESNDEEVVTGTDMATNNISDKNKENHEERRAAQVPDFILTGKKQANYVG